MKSMIGALYEDLSVAYFVVLNLRQHGFQSRDISLMAKDLRPQPDKYAAMSSNEEGARLDWANYDTLLGNMAGLLVGMTTISVPEMGPVIAAGPVTAPLREPETSAKGVEGALTRLGIWDDEAEIFTEGIRREKVLVMAVADPALEDDASKIMRAFAPVIIEYHSGSLWYRDNRDRDITTNEGSPCNVDRTLDSSNTSALSHPVEHGQRSAY